MSWLRVPLGSAIVFAVSVCLLVALTVGHSLPWWAATLIGLAAATVLFVPVRGRLIASQWPVVAARFLRRRRRPVRPELPAPADISVISGEAGVRWDGHTLVAAVEVAPDLALTLESGGAASTSSELPLGLVASMMSQYGLTLDIDIVSAGRHVPPGTAYRTVYSQSVGPRPLVGQRRTWLVLRLNDLDNLAGVVERGPSRRGAPKALAAAAHRVVQRLGQEEIRAHVLSAEELTDLDGLLLDPVGADARERWSTVQSGTRFITTYTSDAHLLAEGQWDRWWSWRTEDALVTVRMRAQDEATTVAVLMRYVHEGKLEQPLPDTRLALSTGEQSPMLTAGVPGGDRSMQVAIPSAAAPLAAVAEVTVPIGPSGQILGQYDDGTLVAAPLWDQTAHPRRWRIDAQVGTEVARQLVLRALVTGAVVALHTDNRARWDGLVASVGDPQRLYYATAGARACDVAVFDGRPVSTVPTRTVLRLLDDPAPGGADMTLVEAPGQILEVRVGAGEPQLLWVIRSREEDRYLGLGETPAPPRRVVSTEPVLSRAPRRPAAPPPDLPAAPTSADAPPPRSRRAIAGPQRVARSGAPQPGTGAAEPGPGRRGYRLPSPDQPPRR